MAEEHVYTFTFNKVSINVLFENEPMFSVSNPKQLVGKLTASKLVHR